MNNKTKTSIKIVSVLLSFIMIFNNIASVAVLGIIKKAKINLKETYSVVNEEENSIQIACVGNSNLYSGFSPYDLWNQYGYTSTICASARQTIEESFNIMKKLFNRQKPKLVIIDSDMLFDHNPRIKNECKKSYCIKDLFMRIRLTFLKQDIQNILSVLKRSNNSRQINTHGYKYSSKICKINCVDYMKKTDTTEEIPQVNKNQMDKLIKLCRDNSNEILMIAIPSISSWNYERHNAAAAFADSRALKFIDLNLLYREIGLDPAQCFRDKGSHMNYSGAKAITNYIGYYIKSSYSIENLKGNQKYTYWNDNYQNFMAYKSKLEE